MKTTTESKIVVENGYTITTEEYTKTGIFFQSPIQSLPHEVWDSDCPKGIISAAEFEARCKNPLYRLVQILLGNGEQVKHASEWLDDMDLCAIHLNTIVCPIYFKRNYRELKAVALSPSAIVQRVHSIGYESPFNNCQGACVEEDTEVITRSTLKEEHHHFHHVESYCYTYKHKIFEDLIKETVMA